MPGSATTNWFGDVVSHPQVIVDANSVDDIAAILKDPGKYPSPVRAMGSESEATWRSLLDDLIDVAWRRRAWSSAAGEKALRPCVA